MNRKLSVFAAAAAGCAVLAGVAAAAGAPTATTRQATNIQRASAVLQGSVTPNGASTTYYFQWGLTTGYGTNGAPHGAGAGAASKRVNQRATGLVAGTTYHYRLVATNQFGTAFGDDRTFTTAGHPPPGVVTGPVLGLSTTGGTLTGAVIPSGQRTTWFFQWGTNTKYGRHTASTTTTSGTGTVPVASALGGLKSGTVYHYRLVANHQGAPTTLGADRVFMTYPNPRPVPTVQAGTTPFHPRLRPYVLRTSGSVIAPPSIPQPFGCNGNVTIRFFRGLKQVGFTLAGIQPNCTFSGKTVFFGIPGGRRRHPHRPVQLRVVIRSISNNYLATNRAPIEHVELG